MKDLAMLLCGIANASNTAAVHMLDIIVTFHVYIRLLLAHQLSMYRFSDNKRFHTSEVRINAVQCGS
jgi:hypothetical protein